MAKKRQSFFTLNELNNDVFAVNEHERKVFMPNEIFSDLLERFDGEMKAKSSTHIAFAYAYTYLAHYMYRYCRYYKVDGYTDIDEKMIKQIMGFPAKADQYTYITKKGGILDELAYIRKESDKPFQYHTYETAYANEDGVGIVGLEGFDMESGVDINYRNTKNRKINCPVKGFERDKKMITNNYLYEDEERTGSFFRVDNTHMIDIETFNYCMSQPELGVEGFYLYSFLLYKCDKHNGSFDCSNKEFVASTGLSIDIIKMQLRNLEERNMIDNDHKPWCLDKQPWQTAKANTYGVLAYSKFFKNTLNYKVIPKQRKIGVIKNGEKKTIVLHIERTK